MKQDLLFLRLMAILLLAIVVAILIATIIHPERVLVFYAKSPIFAADPALHIRSVSVDLLYLAQVLA